MSERLKHLIEKYDYLTARESLDWPAVNCPTDKVFEFLGNLKDNEGFSFLTDVTAIDYYEESPRFVVVYHLLDCEKGVYLRVATPCQGDETPVCPSVVSLWPTADWHERETFDMFGIQFENHPDLRRILMWDEYPHHPLRKEFPLAGHETEIPVPDIVEETGLKAKPAPMMGGPFHSGHKGQMSDREPRADDESWNESAEKNHTGSDVDKPREFKSK